MTQQRCNQNYPGYGALYRASNPFSSINKLQRMEEESEIKGGFRAISINHNVVNVCGS